MERPQNLKARPYESSKSEQITLIVIIILFNMVGIIGFSIAALQPVFLKIVPWFLLLMLAVIIISHKPLSEGFLLLAPLIFLTGFLAEWAGVHTGLLFGNYKYGGALGLKLFAVPLTIGINWFLLVYSTGILMQRTRIRNIFGRVITGALILVLLDILIEPVAVKFDYWQWAGNIIPLKNYICWFLLSTVMLFMFEKFNFKKQSMVAPVFLGMQFLFFVVLSLL